jgi:hypothetical protein
MDSEGKSVFGLSDPQVKGFRGTFDLIALFIVGINVYGQDRKSVV